MASGGNGEPRPFTADELNNFNGDWSLKCDLQLLSSLKSLSGSLFKDAGTLLERVQGLAHDTEDKSVKVSNVINDLQMMASHQFIENRVYDEESEDIAIQQRPQETRGEVDMVSRISQSLRQGMQLLDKEFKDAPSITSHIQSPDSDDDQDNLSQEVYDMMNRSRFASKKLAPIIGSQDFTKYNFHSLFSDGPLQSVDDFDGPVVYSFKQEDQAVVEPSFEAYEGQEDDDYDDRQEPQDIVISDSSDSDDFFKPHPSIVSRKSLPAVAAPPPPPLFNSPDISGDLFDGGEEDMFKPSVPKVSTEPTQPLSFKDELNRRLANGSVAAEKKQVIDTPDIPASTVIKNATHEVKSVPEVKPEGIPEAVKTSMVQAPHHHVTVQAQAKQAIVSNNVTQDSKANKPKFDFFSDDDDTDDNFDIFAKKPSLTKQVLSKVKPAKILDSSSDDEDFKTTKVPVSFPPRKVSEATEGKRQHPHQHQRPEEEAKHRQSLPPEKETPSFMPFKDKVLQNQTQGTDKSQPTSILFQDDSDSDEDLFSQRITKKKNESLVSSNRASLSGITSKNNQDTVVNSLEESQEDSTAAFPSKSDSPIVPEEVPLRRKSPSSASESEQTEKMDRKSIASRLENTIFGSGPKKKPVGGISIFKDVNPPKPQTDSKTVTDEKNEKVTEEVEEAASNATLVVAAEVPTSKDVNRMSTSSVKSVVESQSVSSEQLTDPSSKSTPQKVDESPQLLQNNSLKTRAKIPVPRKRPTRAGRLSQSTSSPVITSSVSHVSDDSIGNESINEVKETPSKSVIFEAKEDHEDLFSSPRSSNKLNTERKRSDVFDDKSPKVTQQRSQQQPKSVDKSVKDSKTKVTKSSIFSDSEDDEDIFSKVSQKQTKSNLPKAGKTLFGDSSEDEIQAVSKKEVPSSQGKQEPSPTKKIDEDKKEIKKEDPKKMPTVKKGSSSKKLFDDDSDDDDLFAPKSKS